MLSKPNTVLVSGKGSSSEAQAARGEGQPRGRAQATQITEISEESRPREVSEMFSEMKSEFSKGRARTRWPGKGHPSPVRAGIA